MIEKRIKSCPKCNNININFAKGYAMTRDYCKSCGFNNFEQGQTIKSIVRTVPDID